MGFNTKRISDPIYGTIELSEVEAQIIGTKSFQRLHNIRHLGLAYLVFPTAGFSRFSHSIGVCHVTGLMLENLRRNSKIVITDDEIQLYRLAALMHDIGHYPFSHVMEQAIKSHYTGSLIKAKEDVDTHNEQNEKAEKYFLHERLGKEVLLKDEEINNLLCDNCIDPHRVYSIFMRQGPLRFTNLISSDLDADRIDYLLRTSHHTGLPYGSIDYHYFLNQMRVDGKNHICLTSKTLRTADHFLLGRYFDYQQVSYHKTVAALELLLKDVITALLKNGQLTCSAEWISEAIVKGKWQHFDDSNILQEILKLYEHKDTDEISKIKAGAILYRMPPKLICETERICRHEKTSYNDFLTQKHLIEEKIPTWASKFGIDKSLWYTWYKPGITLTKIGSHISVSSIEGIEDGEKDKYDQSIRVLDSEGLNSKPIVEIPHSLMSVLSDYALYSMRIYILFSNEDDNRREEICKAIKSDLNSIQWT